MSVTNTTLDPQLAAILDSKVDVNIFAPVTGSTTQYLLDNSDGTCVLEAVGLDIWKATGGDGIIFQIGAPHIAERIQIAKHPKTDMLIFRANDASVVDGGDNWSQWYVVTATPYEPG